MSEPEAQARALLESGTSVRETAKATGLSKGRVETLRAELAGERRALGLEPLPGAKPGREPLVDLKVKVPREVAEDVERRAGEAGLSVPDYVLSLLRE